MESQIERLPRPSEAKDCWINEETDVTMRKNTFHRKQRRGGNIRFDMRPTVNPSRQQHVQFQSRASYRGRGSLHVPLSYKSRKPFLKHSQAHHQNISHDKAPCDKPTSSSRFAAKYTPRLTFQMLEDIARCEETVHEVLCNLKEFQQSLSTCGSLKSDYQRKQYVNTILLIIDKVCGKSVEEESCRKILGEILSDRCVEFYQLLVEHVRKLSDDPFLLDVKKIEQFCKIFEILLTSFPTSSWSVLPIDDLNEISKFTVLSSDLMERISHLKKQRNVIKEHFKQQRAKIPIKHDESDIFKDWDDSMYKSIGILPSIDELCFSPPPLLRPNIIKGSYKGWEHYYDIQFRLLREDFVAPLRRGIQSFLQGAKGRDLHDIILYRDVQVMEPVFTREGMCFKLSFDNSRFRKNWEHSKRLIYGSLLCLSSDMFQDEIMFGTVLERNTTDLDNGLFVAKFDDHETMFSHQSKKTSFLMAESRAYFEATRHILRSLQNAEIDTMPFSDYLLKFDRSLSIIKPPCYLNHDTPYDLKWLHVHPKMRLSPHLTKTHVEILDPSAWPQASELELDQSQLDAIKMALTQKIAIIQGPPGTGKTYIGYKIVQTLIQNRKAWDPRKTSPIFIMCLTNHALDQFLEGLLDCKIENEKESDNFSSDGNLLRKPNIVRIGGQSKNERIQELNISNVRSWVPRSLLEDRKNNKVEIDKCAKTMIWRSLEKSFKYPVNEFIVGPEGMKRLKSIIQLSHFKQLKCLVSKKKEAEAYALEFWLGLWQKPIEDRAASKSRKTVHQSHRNIVIQQSAGLKNEMITVEGEAEVEARERMLEGDQSRMIISRDNEEENELQNKQNTKKHQIVIPSLLLGKERKPQQEVFKVLKQIQREKPLTIEEESFIEDISKLSLQRRMRLFRLWITKYQENLMTWNERNIKKYNDLCDKTARIQQEINRYSLENAEVIGMTTTGAAKYQHIIHLVKPKIVIVEEAAELLESHIVSALNAGTQHLILIGDHKQLRPKPNEFDLAIKHNLQISLFERLILNGLPHATLMIQHRMRPQIASLVCPHIYDELENHESVEGRDDVKGFDKNLFFFHHEHEEEEDENLLSHSNSYEAEMVMNLCHHILKQGYAPSQVTILTAYTGQLLKIRKLMPKSIFEGVRVVNVDNFQGEENDIIILSLVRNNSINKIGFLKQDNRVCVALSRARLGLYCFGNFKMLRSNAPVWEIIISDVESKGCLGTTFSLHCHNHPETKYTVSEPSEFKIFSPEGGCSEKCLARLECGHSCTLFCHPYDHDHKEFKCMKPCKRTCLEEHPCSLLCYQECNPCLVRVIRTLPDCKHEQEMFCHEDSQMFPCPRPCPKSCPEGHPCKLLCYQKCEPLCKFRVERTIPKCQHKQKMFCHEDREKYLCKTQCEKLCCNEIHACPLYCGKECEPCEITVKNIMPDCGHMQEMLCHIPVELHNCETEVEKIIPECGHTETMLCSTDPSEFSCTWPCSKKIHPCGHLCSNKCGERCVYICEKLVEVTLKCGHKKLVSCYEHRSSLMSVDLSCSSPCERKLKCGHQCRQTCSESCSVMNCKEIVDIQLKCGHKIKTECNKAQSGKQFKNCVQPCEKDLAPCGHRCPGKCGEKCPQKCLKKISVTCPKGHNSSRPCFKNAEPCAKKCKEKLACGHTCGNSCGKPCGPCMVGVEQKCRCGHTHPKQCGNESLCSCTAKCTRRLKCGHICSGVCSECFTSRIHAPCTQKVSFTSFCGHSTTTLCFGIQYKCPQNCQISLCPHNRRKCDHKCLTDCTHVCKSNCQVSCPHSTCTKRCHQLCNAKACREPCTRLLQCGHYCPGLCGEKCLLLCMACMPKKFKEKAFGLAKKTQPSAHQYIQLDCGHFFTLLYLDDCVHGRSREDRLISLPQCPACQKPMTNVKRYWRLTKQSVNDILLIKKICDDNYTLARDDRIRNDQESINLIDQRISRAHKKGVHFERRRLILFNLASTPEGVCLLDMFYYCCALKDPKHILETLFALIFKHNGKISDQFFYDVRSELYRCHLSKAVGELKHCIDKATLKGETGRLNLKAFGSTIEFLRQIDANCHLRITADQYRSHLDGLCNLRISINEIMEMKLEFTKPVTNKGEWYKCSRDPEHLYLMPAGGNRKQRPQCQKCWHKK